MILRRLVESNATVRALVAERDREGARLVVGATELAQLARVVWELGNDIRALRHELGEGGWTTDPPEELGAEDDPAFLAARAELAARGKPEEPCPCSAVQLSSQEQCGAVWLRSGRAVARCTRLWGHDGDHVACLPPQHCLAEWPQSP